MTVVATRLVNRGWIIYKRKDKEIYIYVRFMTDGVEFDVLICGIGEKGGVCNITPL